jgi:hypothetical protein
MPAPEMLGFWGEPFHSIAWATRLVYSNEGLRK